MTRHSRQIDRPHWEHVLHDSREASERPQPAQFWRAPSDGDSGTAGVFGASRARRTASSVAIDLPDATPRGLYTALGAAIVASGSRRWGAAAIGAEGGSVVTAEAGGCSAGVSKRGTLSHAVIVAGASRRWGGAARGAGGGAVAAAGARGGPAGGVERATPSDAVSVSGPEALSIRGSGSRRAPDAGEASSAVSLVGESPPVDVDGRTTPRKPARAIAPAPVRKTQTGACPNRICPVERKTPAPTNATPTPNSAAPDRRRSDHRSLPFLTDSPAAPFSAVEFDSTPDTDAPPDPGSPQELAVTSSALSGGGLAASPTRGSYRPTSIAG
jgi:hypothetical protein